MAKPEKKSTSVTARIHSDILVDIDKHVDKVVKEKPGQTYNRTDAMNEMLPLGLKALQNPKALEAGIIVLKHIDKLKDPELVAELKKHLQEVQIVDYLASLDNDQFDALSAIVVDELRLRAGKRPFSELSPAEKRGILLRE